VLFNWSPLFCIVEWISCVVVLFIFFNEISGVTLNGVLVLITSFLYPLCYSDIDVEIFVPPL